MHRRLSPRALLISILVASAAFPVVAAQSTLPAAQQPAAAAPAQSASLQAMADALAQYFRADPAGFDQLFAPEFLAQVPAARLEAVMKQLYGQLGRCTAVKIVSQANATSGQFQFTFEKGFTAPVSLIVNGQPTHAITTFVIGAPVSSSESLSSVIDQMKGMAGHVSFQAQRLDASAPVTVAELQPALPLAIGSAFKLYVLGALVRQIDAGGRHWNDVVALDTRSLPSGLLQTWPAGTPLTLQSLASLMISISDNTAADQMLKSVGREQVEATLPVMGHSKPSLNQPFLSTMEMFLLKWGVAADQSQAFVAGNTAARRALLQTLASSPASTANMAAANTSTPKMIDTVEWFASASDLGHALAWFQSDAGARPAARQILAINPGLQLPAARWAYIGFKGGSEPGVVSLNFLLRSQSGQWFTVSAIWNDPQALVNDSTWGALVSRAIALLPDASR